ncbi:hypothetical protein VTL71DRAFT_283 [Oculimacula yallundae]|uniref:BTB domain-containing protein n=1 Tax=Oculimacula yallundae TaxID=86028 RepID=A0ABR4CZJ9_9HELO
MSTTDNNKFIEIDPTGDLIIKVVEYDLEAFGQDGNHPVLKTASFKVSRQTLLANCDSAVFKAMLSGAFKEGRESVVTLHEDSVASVELWLRRFYDAFNEDSYEIPIVEVWNAIGFGRKYLFHGEKLNAWFMTYISKQKAMGFSKEDLMEWLYPCEAFSHPVGFAYITKMLAHEGTGHIQERNPSRYRDLHVEGRVIQQLNAARGSMRKEIVKGLFNPLNRICDRECAVHEKSIKSYLNAIRRTGVWPVEDIQHKSNKDIIESAGFVNWIAAKPENACISCLSSLSGAHVLKIRQAILTYWEGLCLDCMDISKPRTGSIDNDYWTHNDTRNYDRGCRIRHKRNTWYFSFMGRAEIMDAFKHEQQARKKAKIERERKEFEAAQESSESDSSDSKGGETTTA